MDALKNHVVRIARDRHVFSVALKCDWSIEPSPYVMVIKLHDAWIIRMDTNKIEVVIAAYISEWDVAILEPWILLIVHVLIPDETFGFAVYFVGVIKVESMSVSPELARFLHIDTLVVAIY